MSDWKKWLIPGAAVPLLALLAFGLTRPAKKLPSALVGKQAPSFRGQTLDGDTASLGELRGNVTILNFWASWCVPCRQEHPVLMRATRTWPDDSVSLVGVVYQDGRSNARAFMQRYGGSWTSILDPGTRTAIDYGVTGVPETFFIGPDGTVVSKHTGPMSWEILRAGVDSAMARTARAGGGSEDGAPADGAAGRQGDGAR